jgi:hypothetical protein
MTDTGLYILFGYDFTLFDTKSPVSVKYGANMKLEYAWAMPNKNTFSIEPIRKMLNQEMTEGLWLDPFANESKLATITNDLNEAYDTDYHLNAVDFLKQFKDGEVDGVLFDPPYSLTQIRQCYDGFGIPLDLHTAQSFYSECRDEIARVLRGGVKQLVLVGVLRALARNEVLLKRDYC